MSSKWNEKLVTSFLKAYKQHPCLWNPYHKGYYSCREKNEALRMIIDALGTPGLTVTDYLQQIKIIREKYKQEQARIIKCMQSQKQYKSPSSWYYIVAEMLRKVISDEERTNSRTTLTSENHDTLSVLKSLSSDDIKESLRREKGGREAKGARITNCTCAGSTYDEIARRSKSAEKPTYERRRSSIASRSDENRSKGRIRFVPCPHLKRKQSVSQDKDEDTILSHKPTRDIESPINEHSSSSKESEKSSESPFLKCPTCGWENLNYNQVGQNAERLVNGQKKCSCSSYIRDNAKNYILCPGYDQVTRDENVDPNSKKYINNSGDFEIFRNPNKQAPSPSVSSRVAETVPSKSNIESATEPKKVTSIGVQYKGESEKPVNVPIQTQILQVDSATARKLQGNIVEACMKIILSGSRGNLKENTSPVSQNVQEVQYNGPELKTKGTEISKNATDTSEVGTNTLNYADVGTQNTVYTSRYASSQTDKEKRRRTETKGVAANIEKETKGIQSTVCVSRANLIYKRSSDGIEIGTTTSAAQVRYVPCTSMERSCSVQSIYDGINVPAIRARSQGSVNRCVRHVDFKSVGTQEIEEPCRSDTCPRNLMSLIKTDPTVALMVQKLLLTILYPKSEQSTQSERSSSSGLQTDNDPTCRLKGNCTVDVTEMINKIKEHTTRTLGTDTSDFRINEAKEFRQKFDAATSSQELQAKPVLTSALTMTDVSDLKSLYRNVYTEPAKPEYPESDTESMKRKYRILSADKETSSTSISNDIQKSAADSASPDKSEQTEPNSVSIGTQKRDPILVRVIKCNGSQAIVRSDKQTLTATLQDKSTEKFVETCGRSTCIPYKIIRRPTESSLESVLRKKRENVISNAHRRRSFLHNNYSCSKNCKDIAHSDWADLDMCFNNQFNLHPCEMHKKI